MTALGYKQSQEDHTLFIKPLSSRGVTVLLVYLDDIIFTGDDWKEQQFLTQHSSKGCPTPKKEAGMAACKPISTPMNLNLKLGDVDDSVVVDNEMYQHLVGKLIYLSHTRPNIAFAVSLVSQFMHYLREVHPQATYRILQYLKGTPRRGVLYKRNENTILEAYTDSDYAGSVIDRRSTSGYCTFLGGNLVTWRSTKQNIVALS
ncbi:putative mitochondrial protein, partial [Mucuna pruriens]